MSHQDVMYLGIGRFVVALSPSAGEELWRRKLPSTTLLTMLVRDDAIYAGAGGELFCLDPRTGEIRWRNPLRGLGTGVILFGETGASGTAAANAAAQSASMMLLAAGAAGAAAAS